VRSHLNCDDCERELTAYLDGALSPAVGRVIAQHLETCGRCRAAYEDYSWIASRIAALPAIEAPAWLEERVLRRTLGTRYALRGWRAFGAASGALAFAASVGIVANFPRIARALGLGDPSTWPLSAVHGAVAALASLSKRLAMDVAFYEPIAREVVNALRALEAIPRAALLALQAPEIQVAGAVAITLGLALYRLLRPSRSHERGVGHACLCL
jgi:anti-sigma factor RsiW